MVRRWPLALLLASACVAHSPDGLELAPPGDDAPGGSSYAFVPDEASGQPGDLRDADEPPDISAPHGCTMRTMAMVVPEYTDREEAIAVAMDVTPDPDDDLTIDVLVDGQFRGAWKVPEFGRSYEDFSVVQDADTGVAVVVGPRTIVTLAPGDAPRVTRWSTKRFRRLTRDAAHLDSRGRLWIANGNDPDSPIATIDADGLGRAKPQPTTLLDATAHGGTRTHGWRFARQTSKRDGVFVLWREVTDDARSGTMRAAWIDTQAPRPQATVLPDVPGADEDGSAIDAVESDDGVLTVVWKAVPPTPSTKPERAKKKRRSSVVRISRWDGEQWTSLDDEELPGMGYPDEGSLHLGSAGELIYARVEANRRVHHSKRAYSIVVRTWTDDGWQTEVLEADPGWAYKEEPRLFTHAGELHLGYLTETSEVVYSASDIAFRMIRERQSARKASTPTTHPRNLRLLVRRDGAWTEAVAGEALLPDAGSRYGYGVLRCP